MFFFFINKNRWKFAFLPLKLKTGKKGYLWHTEGSLPMCSDSAINWKVLLKNLRITLKYFKVINKVNNVN